MKNVINHSIKIKGSFSGNIFVSPNFDLSLNDYNKYFDNNVIDFDTAKKILKNNEKDAITFFAMKDPVINEVLEKVLTSDKFLIGNIPFELNCICFLKNYMIDFRDITKQSQKGIINVIANGFNSGAFIEEFKTIDDVINFYKIDKKTAIILSN